MREIRLSSNSSKGIKYLNASHTMIVKNAFVYVNFLI